MQSKPLAYLRNLAIMTATTVHDEEAMSALELAGRTAAKVNECVKLVNETCKYLQENLPETLKTTLTELIAEGAISVEDDILVIGGTGNE